MRALIIITLALTGFIMQTAMAAQVTGIASVRILAPVKVSMEKSPSVAVSQQEIGKRNSINDISLYTSQDYHYTVSFNEKDTCRLIASNTKTISNTCSTATVNFN